jgi:hypothetical protein
MGRLCRLLFLLAIVTVAVGFFRGWFSVSTSGDENTTTVTTRINKETVREDVNRAVDKLNDWRHHAGEDLDNE